MPIAYNQTSPKFDQQTVMRRSINTLLVLFLTMHAQGQQIDSIYFHLYTDSLKKGQHNYINVDGKLPNGKWLPLTDKEINLSCPEASFEGNELIIPANFQPIKVTIKAVLKKNTSLQIERTIWIKHLPDPALPTEQNRSGKPSRIKKLIAYWNFLASSRNLARPISVSGCLSKPRIESSGQVQTSAPASAHFTI